MGGDHRHENADCVAVQTRAHQDQAAVARQGDDAGDLFGCWLLGVAILDELDREHRTQTTNVANTLMSRGDCIEPRPQIVTKDLGLLLVRRIKHLIHRDDRGSTRDRVATERAAKTTRMHCVEQVGSARDTRDRHTATHRLGPRREIGRDAKVFDCRRRTGAPHAGLHLVGDVENSVLLTDLMNAANEFGRHRQEATLALDRLENDGGDLRRIDLALEDLAESSERILRRNAAIQVGRRGAIDLSRVRTHALLVWHRLRRQRHAHQRAPMEALVETDDRVAIRRKARDLDSVLDGLGTRIEQQSLERTLTRMAGNHALDGFDVALVLDDRVHLVHVAGRLLLHRSHNRLGRVSAVERANAPDEVDELAPINVGDARTMRVVGKDRLRVDRRRNPALTLGLQCRSVDSNSLIDRHGVPPRRTGAALRMASA